MLYPNLLNFMWLFLYPKRLKVAGQWRSSGTVLFSYDVEEYLDHIPSAYWNFRQAEACPSISTYLLQTCSSSISLSSQWHQQLFGDRTQNPEVPFSCSLSLFPNIKSTTRHFGASLWCLFHHYDHCGIQGPHCFPWDISSTPGTPSPKQCEWYPFDLWQHLPPSRKMNIDDEKIKIKTMFTSIYQNLLWFWHWTS